MKRVKYTKNPSPTQIGNLTKNLQEAYQSSYVAIDHLQMAHKNGSYTNQFWFDVSGVFCDHISTWKGVLSQYEKLMKEAKNG